MFKKINLGIFILFILLVFNFSLSADLIYLKSGGTLRGKILSETEDSMRVEFSSGSVERVDKDLVGAVVKDDEKLSIDPEEEYRKKLESLSEEDAQGHYKLGIFCFKNKLFNHALKEFKLTIELNPKKYEMLTDKYIKHISLLKEKAAEIKKMVRDRTKTYKPKPDTTNSRRIPVELERIRRGHLLVPHTEFERDAIILFLKDEGRYNDFARYEKIGDEYKAGIREPLTKEELKRIEVTLYCYQIAECARSQDKMFRIYLKARIRGCESLLKRN